MYQFLRVPWGKIRFRNWGLPYQEAEKRVLFVNGAVSGINQWSLLADKVLESEKVALIGYDLPGIGQSTAPEYYYSMPNLQGYSIYCMMKQLRWDTAHICAFSLGLPTLCTSSVKFFFIPFYSSGAHLASVFSLLFPEMVESFTNIDGFFHFRIDPDTIATSARQEIEKNLELYKAGKPNKSMIMSYADFVAGFKVLVKYSLVYRIQTKARADKYPEIDWDRIADIMYKDFLLEVLCILVHHVN